MSSTPSSPRKTAQVERLYGQNGCKSPSLLSTLSPLSKRIPTAPEESGEKGRVHLTSVDFEDDFYLNLLAWHHSGIITGQHDRVVVYPHRPDTTILADDEIAFELSLAVTAVGSISDHPAQVVVGDRGGRVTILDCDRLEAVGTVSPHCSRVGVIDYSPTTRLLATGSRDSKVALIDQRQPKTTSLSMIHRQEVCGLKWSPCGNLLATGGNDNVLSVKDVRMMDGKSVARVESAHAAAIKALAWLGNTLYSGGGTSDRRICAWTPNGNPKQPLWSCLTPSQVCCLLTSPTVSPTTLLSTHGFTDNLVLLWDTKTMSRQNDPKQCWIGHKSRVLYGAVSPCGRWVGTGAGDGTVRLWEAFKESAKTKQRRLLESKYSPFL